VLEVYNSLEDARASVERYRTLAEVYAHSVPAKKMGNVNDEPWEWAEMTKSHKHRVTISDTETVDASVTEEAVTE
jgi:hypothetical protein